MKITNQGIYTAKPTKFEQVDRDDPPLRTDTLRRDLTPARPGPRLNQPPAFYVGSVDTYRRYRLLERRATSIADALRLLNIRIVELALEASVLRN